MGENNILYTLIYDANGGENAPASVSKNGNSNYAIFDIDSQTPSREGFVFSGWSFEKDGKVNFHEKDMVTIPYQNMTVYAVWTPNSVVNLGDSFADENVEPLGVFTSSDAPYEQQVLGDTIGFSIIFGAIILGIIGLILFRKREPRILTMEVEE